MNRSMIRPFAPALAGALALAWTTNDMEAQRPQEDGAPPAIEEKTAAMDRMDGFFPIYREESAGRIWLEIGLWDTDVLHASGVGAGWAPTTSASTGDSRPGRGWCASTGWAPRSS